MENDLGVSRKTASKYMEKLTESGFLRKEIIWKTSYYMNVRLYNRWER